MIDITPRNQNYSSTMGSTNYNRQNNSPIQHSSSFARDRELNDAEGKYNHIFRLFSFAHQIKMLSRLKQQSTHTFILLRKFTTPEHAFLTGWLTDWKTELGSELRNHIWVFFIDNVHDIIMQMCFQIRWNELNGLKS